MALSNGFIINKYFFVFVCQRNYRKKKELERMQKFNHKVEKKTHDRPRLNYSGSVNVIPQPILSWMLLFPKTEFNRYNVSSTAWWKTSSWAIFNSICGHLSEIHNLYLTGDSFITNECLTIKDEYMDQKSFWRIGKEARFCATFLILANPNHWWIHTHNSTNILSGQA